jgi:hypothetical protein
VEPDKPAVTTLDPRKEAFRRDIESALRVHDLVTMALKAGADPKYIAARYGVDLERCERYVAALKAQEGKKREREITARGDSELPEVG